MRLFFQSFRYAWNGLIAAVRAERNLRFHMGIAFYVYLFSLFYSFSTFEYCIITLLVGVMLALELVNSALERAVSHPSPEKYHEAGLVKDMAAAAVLVFSVAAVVCGILLFWQPAVLRHIPAWFFARPLWLLPLALSLVGWGWFIFGKRRPQ